MTKVKPVWIIGKTLPLGTTVYLRAWHSRKSIRCSTKVEGAQRYLSRERAEAAFFEFDLPSHWHILREKI